MGLAGLKNAWQRQTKYFGHDKSQYSVLLIDNRGVGESDRPILRYTTSAMALDYLEVLTHLNWIPSDWPNPASAPDRAFHLVGISLGGMIAQEIAYRIPSYISSLTLLCTTASVENTKSWLETMRERVNMFIPKGMEATIASTARNIFPEHWLHAPDETLLPGPSRTPRCGPSPGSPDGEYIPFDTNFQRFQAQELHKKLAPSLFTTTGLLLQLAAAALHDKSPAQLKEMGDKIGRERILVVHGSEDRMIAPELGDRLIKRLEPGRTEIVEGMGHAPVMERPEWMNGVLEEHFAAFEG